MKRFDKGYIYSGLLSDLFSSFIVLFIFFNELFLDENANAEEITATVPFLVIAFAVIYLCFIAYRIMYYRTSGYELTKTEIKCNRGVFFRKRSVLDYKRVHAINKKQGLIQRIFGIAVLTIDSGSANTAHQAEITIIEKSKTVDALVSELNALKEGGVREAADTEKNEELLISDKDSLYRFTSKKKMLYTLISIATTVFFTALFGALIIVVLGICKFLLQLDFLGSLGEYFLVAVSITVGLMLLSAVFSFIGCMIHSFVGYYDFNITRCDNNIQISYGLLERHTNTFNYNRIKAVKITQGLVQRMLGFAVIKLEVIGYTTDAENDSAELGVLIPFCRYEEIDEILERVLPDYIPDKKQTKAVSFFPFISWFYLTVGIVTGIALLLTVAIMSILDAPPSVILPVALSILGAGLIALILKLVSALLAYQINGISVNNGKITVYSGSFTKSITVFLSKNLIAVENVTTPLRKRAGIASLVMHLKTNETSNEVKVHIQKDNLSEELEKLLIL